MKKNTEDAITAELFTICDYVRYAVSRFAQSDIVFGHGTGTAQDEAAFIVLESLHLPLDSLEVYWHARLTESERTKILSLIEARIATRKPAPYLLNKAYIQGVPFYVDERVIVPRSYIGELMCAPEAGGLADDAQSFTRVLDLCTGSGCLAILAAMVFENAEIDAVDISGDALAVARRNVTDHGMEDRVNLFSGDLFAPLKDRRYDLIISNPPYVDAEGMNILPPEYRHEPALALAAGEDGLDIVRRILNDAKNFLTPRGALVCEIGRCRPALEQSYPDLPFLWLDTAESSGEVFRISAEDL